MLRFARVRPFAYHSTALDNLPLIQHSRVLRPAADWIREGGDLRWLTCRRERLLTLDYGSHKITLKDQMPLILANCALAEGWTCEDFIAHLNEHVYFWPGTEKGPIAQGTRLIEHYAEQGAAILRMSTMDLLEANADCEPLFSAFNSGAPRKVNGRPSPRGPDLFRPAETFPRSASEVVELVFRGRVKLPPSLEVANRDGTWTGFD